MALSKEELDFLRAVAVGMRNMLLIQDRRRRRK